MKNTTTKIMVVDDEIGICKNVEKILAKNNYTVVHTQSAKKALEMMKKDEYSLLISDIVMPEMNGLELLKNVAKDLPGLKTIMMTGYASTNTAVKAIRLGALDYIPKPFTPDELRTAINKALSGELTARGITDQERDAIETMDVEIDFGTEAASNLVKPDAEPPAQDKQETAEFFCPVGNMSCDVMEKLGATCKTGLNKNYCPKLKAKKSKEANATSAFNPKTMIGIDQPFDYNEVVAVTGPEYVRYLDRDGFAFLPYEELKKVNPTKAGKISSVVSESKNILVVDDEVSVNNNIRKILGKNGFTVDQAVTKEEAVEKINQLNYKLVLLDLRMPGVAGLELLESIAKAQPFARVIIITGYASIQTAIESARIGAVDYLPKPFTPDELREVTDRAYALAV
ncbi:MAG: response regulator [Proteobacteria bacterium]|nr:response regulator [Pseudomonadota bacterium]MBU1388430.1 response regulator [Pseudomonadota bacterium]MBU1542746.1 response regulator [Pseudomonadota bacterium]MBU2481280.1 response regulator [Pseudomonadota bacterium]